MTSEASTCLLPTLTLSHSHLHRGRTAPASSSQRSTFTFKRSTAAQRDEWVSSRAPHATIGCCVTPRPTQCFVLCWFCCWFCCRFALVHLMVVGWRASGSTHPARTGELQQSDLLYGTSALHELVCALLLIEVCSQQHRSEKQRLLTSTFLPAAKQQHCSTPRREHIFGYTFRAAHARDGVPAHLILRGLE